MKIAITGAHGLLGKHMQAFYKALNTPEKKIELILIGKSDFQSAEALAAKLEGIDALFHLAGVNRAEPEVVFEENQKIIETLLKGLDIARSRPHILFSNSTHISRDTHYGRTKRLAAEKLQAWCAKEKVAFTNYVLPHIFGEHGKPFYNSVVSTFCYQLANDETLKVDQDSQLELVHCYDVALAFHKALLEKTNGEQRLTGHPIMVSELKKKLEHFKDQYFNHKVIPSFTTHTDLYLFNTFRSYCFPQKYPVMIDVKSDQRGYLIENVKTDHGGQSFLSWTKPQITRGNHWHIYKIERFCVVQGEALIQIRSIFDDKVHEFKVSGDKPCYIDMPTLHTHNIKNIDQSELITAFWSHEIFNPAKPDTYAEVV